MTDRAGLLLTFLQERDVRCPLCGYNLRNLTQPQCPECRQHLRLTVGIAEPRFGWFLVTLTPSIFSGIAALLFLVPIIAVPLTGGGAAPWFILAVDAFGWLSGIAGIVLVVARYAFLQQPPAAQRLWAVGAWVVHLGVFVGLLAAIFLL